MIDIKEYMHVVDEIVWRYCVNHKDWIDDAKGEGNIALWETIQNWDQKEREKQGEGNFEAYARTCVRNAVLDFIRKEEIRKIIIPAEGIENMGQANRETPLKLLIEKEEKQQAWEIFEELLGKLNDREKYVLHNHIMPDDPMILEQIAEVFKCHLSSVFRDKERILKRLGMDNNDA